MAINVITGAYTSEEWWGEVRIDGEVLSPEQSLRVMRHSPDGFAWGYRGSGPAQLALGAHAPGPARAGGARDLP